MARGNADHEQMENGRRDLRARAAAEQTGDGWIEKGRKTHERDEELERRDRREMEHLNKRYELLVKEALRRFGEWDVGDPVVWKLLHVVVAQNDLSAAYLASQEVDTDEGDRMVDAALAERREAIEALRQARSEDEETNEYD
jgi:hypothetical protein